MVLAGSTDFHAVTALREVSKRPCIFLAKSFNECLQAEKNLLKPLKIKLNHYVQSPRRPNGLNLTSLR